MLRAAPRVLGSGDSPQAFIGALQDDVAGADAALLALYGGDGGGALLALDAALEASDDAELKAAVARMASGLDVLDEAIEAVGEDVDYTSWSADWAARWLDRAAERVAAAGERRAHASRLAEDPKNDPADDARAEISAKTAERGSAEAAQRAQEAVEQVYDTFDFLVPDLQRLDLAAEGVLRRVEQAAECAAASPLHAQVSPALALVAGRLAAADAKISELLEIAEENEDVIRDLVMGFQEQEEAAGGCSCGCACGKEGGELELDEAAEAAAAADAAAALAGADDLPEADA